MKNAWTISVLSLLTLALSARVEEPGAEIGVRGPCNVDTFLAGAVLYTNRPYVVAECLDYVKGRLFLRGSTGVAFMRRDGFVSMDAKKKPGELLTRPVRFSGMRLFVNADVDRGDLRVEIVDESGKPIAPFTLDDCRPLCADSTIQQVTWKGDGDLSSLKNKTVRFRFRMKNGSLYAFWVSRDESGRSDGDVAAGGPGYRGPIDTVGKIALDME